MENNKNKKSVKFRGDMLNFCDFIQVFVFTRNHHLNSISVKSGQWMDDNERLCALMEPCADKPFLDSFHNIGL